MKRFKANLQKNDKQIFFFKERKTLYLNVKRKSFPIYDGLNILIKTVTCLNNTVIGSQHGYYNEAFLSKVSQKR